MTSAHWNDFEHKLWHVLKFHELDKAESFLLAVSGGVDSMVLLWALARVKPQARLRVAHFHHGHIEQARYRDHVAELVQHKISEMNSDKMTASPILFHFKRATDNLKSEADMRRARWAFLRAVRSTEREPILTGHHFDDWLETGLLKMIRGTSLEGLAGFQMWNQEIFRPFLNLPKAELLHYAKQQKISYLQDPSNQSSDYLRNWVREKWLPALEERQPGGVAQLSRSLLQIVDDHQKTSTFELKFYEQDSHKGIDRCWFLTLSRPDQMKAVALYLKNRQIFEFTRGQLEEIIKRLDKNQKDLTFEIIDRKWVINASQIMLK